MTNQKLRAICLLWFIISVVLCIIYLFVPYSDKNIVPLICIFTLVAFLIIIFIDIIIIYNRSIYIKSEKILKREGYSDALIEEYKNIINKLDKSKFGNPCSAQMMLASIYHDRNELVNSRLIFENISVDEVYKLSQVKKYNYSLAVYYNNGLYIYLDNGFIDKADAIYMAGKITIEEYLQSNQDYCSLLIYKNYISYYILKKDIVGVSEMVNNIINHPLYKDHKYASICLELCKYYISIGQIDNMKVELEKGIKLNNDCAYPSLFLQEQFNEISNNDINH